jgi:plasmid stabilization system protein ParE
MPIGFSAAARDDLDSIAAWIRSFNPSAAARTVRRIREVCRAVLGKHPLVGEACEELGAGLRRFTVDQRYVIYFRPSPCIVVHIYDASRDHESLVREG